ncbi:MAG: 50S ribosomal protein L11 methyltransferase [Betaproteobacteria bacterium]|nr:50S ribosomal protein L11 methyltransferase [Betaproteobacteria bacterium]
MHWQTLLVEVAAPDTEALADALLEAGAQSVSIEDADAGSATEAPQFAEPGAVLRPWQRNRIVALFDPDSAPAVALDAAVLASGCDAPSAFRMERLVDRDWVRATQQQFVPIRIVEGLWVVPSWSEPPEPDAVNLRIDPGLAFGTGSHPTTRLVLAWLARELRNANGERGDPIVLDYGCGSGILTIAAAKLGAAEAFGVDIDPQALVTTAENAARNHARVRLFLPDALPAFCADVVVANILARPLIVLAPLLSERAGRRIALSGILADQAGEVLAAYRDQFEIGVAGEEDGWVLLSGDRR